MRHALDELPITGRVVVGAPEEDRSLPVGVVVGGGGEEVDLASTRSRAEESSRAAVPVRCR
jgi:fructose-1,6-bisphosphatase/sedoheptulose 1,7-bisphosphatase-like protein